MNAKPTTHFIGIGGTGLSAIARVLVERGEHVTGSDREDSALAKSLRQLGVSVTIGHAAGNANGATRVVRSSAVGDDNIEVQAALAKGVPVFKRSEFLGELLADQQVIAVAGSHGKTTTTAMIAWILTALNQKPGYIIGSVAQNLGVNASAGGGRLFVVEADEYDYMFLGLSPNFALVTNVEHDHPDLFPTPRDFQLTFERFVDRIQPDGILIACDDDPGASDLLAYARGKGRQLRIYSTGNPFSNYWLDALMPSETGISFLAMHESQKMAAVDLQIPGTHNALNALGALALVDQLGFSVSEAAMALSDFRGTERRFEIRGEANGVLIVDDYAHHPTEIRSTLAAARARYPKRRILALWQPHTYSRTIALKRDFAKSFEDADRVVITDIYAAREQKPVGFDMTSVVNSIDHGSVKFVQSLSDAQSLLNSDLQPGDILVVMSAGDAIELSSQLFTSLKKKEENHA